MTTLKLPASTSKEMTQKKGAKYKGRPTSLLSRTSADRNRSSFEAPLFNLYSKEKQ